MQVLCLGGQRWDSETKATSGVPAEDKRARMGSLGARGNKEHCGPAGGVRRGLTDMI